MPKRATIDNCGEFGVIADVHPSELPKNAFSSARNVRCTNSRIETIGGYSELTALAKPALYLAGFQTSTTAFWVYAVDNDADGIAEKLYSYSGSETNITRQIAAADDDYGGTSPLWTHTYLSGALVINNGEDAAQYWPGAGRCLNMPYTGANDWESTAGGGETYRAKSVRSFKNYLFALNITDNGTRYPSMVHWSDAVAPGDIANIDWDYSDSTIDAARRDLSETPGEVIDGLPLRDSFIVYKEDSVYSFTYSGDAFVFQSRLLTRKRGIINQNCVVDIGGQHIVVDVDDVYIHDGTRFETVIDDKVHSGLFSQMGSDLHAQTYLAHNKSEFEVWICFTTSGSLSPDKAWIYNYRSGQWTPRDLPGVYFIASGIVSDTSIPEDYDDETVLEYDSETSWDYTQRAYLAHAQTLAGAKDNIIIFDGGETIEGAAITSIVERTDLDLGQPDDWHEVSAIYPRMSGNPVAIKMGCQKRVGGPVTWGDDIAFDPESDVAAYTLTNGKLHAIRISGSKFALDALSFDYEESGRE